LLPFLASNGGGSKRERERERERDEAGVPYED